MTVRTSQYNPTAQIPEKSWAYRLAKRFWFSDFGTYKGMDHTKESAPAILAKQTTAALTLTECDAKMADSTNQA
jgi:hypothetical protein